MVSAWQIKETFDTTEAALRAVALVDAPLVVRDYLARIIASMTQDGNATPRRVLRVESHGIGSDNGNENFMSNTIVEWIKVGI